MSNSIPIRDPETGCVYPSQREFCRATGLSLSTISGRKKRKTLSQDMINFPGDLHKVTAKDPLNRVFESMADMCRAWGIKPQTFYYRLSIGQNIEKALSPVVPRKRARDIDITIDGQRFLVLRELAAYLKLPEKTLDARIRRGWTPEELKLPALPGGIKNIKSLRTKEAQHDKA